MTALSPPPAADPTAPLQLLPGAPDAANRMYGLIVGSWFSQIAGALARLGLPDRLATEPRSVPDLAIDVNCPADTLHRLVRAAAALGILTLDHDGQVGLTPLGACLRTDLPGSLAGLARTLTDPCHWQPWSRLTDAVRTGSTAAPAALGAPFFTYLQAHPDELDTFTTAMGELSDLIADAVVRVLDLSTAREVVDVGGGSGRLLAALLDHHPTLRGTVLELPPVAASARALLTSRGLADRGSAVDGDFFDAVPPADAYLLKIVLHDWDDEHATRILRNCAQALRPGGHVYVIDAVVPDDLSQPLPALLDLHMHVLLGGRERTLEQHTALLHAAGLHLDRVIATDSHAPVLQASHA